MVKPATKVSFFSEIKTNSCKQNTDDMRRLRSMDSFKSPNCKPIDDPQQQPQNQAPTQAGAQVFTQRHRHWCGSPGDGDGGMRVRAHFIDEISVVPPAHLLQADVRTRSAKQVFHVAFGALGGNI